MTVESHNLEGVLLGMGNPLLDISAEVDDALLSKYELQANNAILAEKKHTALYPELVNKYKVDYVAGGAAQNSIRGAQWMLPAKSTVYIGCVGEDEYAATLQKAAESEGVRVEYMKTSEIPTGTCAVLITGINRSLVANLSAAEKYQVEHLKTPSIWSLVEKAKYFYISGFFLTVSPASIMTVAQHAAEKNKLFCMNLSAPFLSQFFKEPMDSVLPYWDYIFGNETEAVAFAESHNLGTKSVPEIALKLSQMPKVNKNRPRIVVFTQGADPVVVATEGKIVEYPIIPIKREEIIDTNGAGDAFVGGYLSQLVQGKSIETCVKAGNYLANIVIRRSGPTYPKDQKPQTKFD